MIAPMSKTVCIIQARMGSTRLPGKVLLPLPTGRTVLEEVIERVKGISGLDDIIVATPNSKVDDLLVPYIRGAGVGIYRGPEQDVLFRYYQAAMMARASTIMRITADCPMLNPELCSQVLAKYADDQSDFDYVSNTVVRTFPRGLDCEVFSWRILKITHENARRPYDREHVTQWMLDSWARPRIKVGSLHNDRDDNSEFDWSLDTLDDYHRIVSMMRPKPALPKAVAGAE